MSDDESSIGESTGNNTRYIKPVVSPLNIPPTVHTSFTSDSATPTPHTSNGPPPASPQASRGPPPPSPAASRSPSSYFSFAFPRRNNSSRTVHKSNDVEMGEVGEKTKNMEKTDNPENTEDTENTHKKKVVRVDFKGTNEKSKTPRMHVMSNDDFKLHNRFRLCILYNWLLSLLPLALSTFSHSLPRILAHAPVTLPTYSLSLSSSPLISDYEIRYVGDLDRCHLGIYMVHRTSRRTIPYLSRQSFQHRDHRERR